MLVTPLPKGQHRNGGSKEKVTRMIKGMENSYEERLRRWIISSKTVTNSSIEKKNIYIKKEKLKKD